MNHSGDITGDGKLDRSDLDLLRQLVAHHELVDQLSPEQRALLDVNHDGSIDEKDIEALCQLLMKSSSSGKQSPENAQDRLHALRQKIGKSS